ncbi:hypothetical protein BESB_021760 [Besnoitia besnoiti]|uniref:Transmembrane protein n=1 Tax=Besnoitia besnoiti TaxID=94643 RepID=A0A2A9M2N8_BESBE|nr:hypothetical protein BESB_021760 [Besnoitia besnoiti]PFH32235.1 hypothetical protein BESB_021760 [Besnoitia besnoiti]
MGPQIRGLPTVVGAGGLLFSVLCLFFGPPVEAEDVTPVQPASGLRHSGASYVSPEPPKPGSNPRDILSSALSELVITLKGYSSQDLQGPLNGVGASEQATSLFNVASNKLTAEDNRASEDNDASSSATSTPSQNRSAHDGLDASNLPCSSPAPKALRLPSHGDVPVFSVYNCSLLPSPVDAGLQGFEPHFRLLSLYPVSTNTKFVLKGLQPLLATFSIPVVPLGGPLSSDSDKPEKAAFSVQANNSLGTIPGRGYWMTPKVYRFQPFNAWPTDLEVVVKLNGDLRSLSGKLIDRADPYWIRNNVREFKTARLVARVRSVTSKLASGFTDGKWSATLSNSADPFSSHLEIPPDGQVLITFNAPVDLANLNDERLHLRLLAVAHFRPGVGMQEDQYFYVDYDARQCSDAEIDGLVARGTDTASGSTDQGGRSPEEIVCCAVLFFSREPLRTGEEYELLMRKRTRYNKLSGPTGLRKKGAVAPPDAAPIQVLRPTTLSASSASVFSRFLTSMGENPYEETLTSQDSQEDDMDDEDEDAEDEDAGEDHVADESVGGESAQSRDQSGGDSGLVYTETTLNIRHFDKIGEGSFGIQLTGLRPFKFFGTGSSSFRSMPTVRYRRLTFLLPHSLNGYQPSRRLWEKTRSLSLGSSAGRVGGERL